MNEVFRVVGSGREGRFFFTCEHASNHVFDFVLSQSDAALLSEHWGYDLGVAPLTTKLAERLDAPAVLSNFSRLLIDPNRELISETLIRTECDGQLVNFNRDLTAEQRQERIDRFYTPFHDSIDNAVSQSRSRHPSRPMVSMHSFTPVFQGKQREVEIGILFDDFEEDAHQLAAALTASGFKTGLNVPYSGYDGFIYSVKHHAEKAGAKYLELEVRQDLIADDGGQERVAKAVASALQTLQ